MSSNDEFSDEFKDEFLVCLAPWWRCSPPWWSRSTPWWPLLDTPAAALSGSSPPRLVNFRIAYILTRRMWIGPFLVIFFPATVNRPSSISVGRFSFTACRLQRSEEHTSELQS